MKKKVLWAWYKKLQQAGIMLYDHLFLSAAERIFEEIDRQLNELNKK